MSATKIRFLGEIEGSLSAQVIADALNAQPVQALEDAELVVDNPGRP